MQSKGCRGLLVASRKTVRAPGRQLLQRWLSKKRWLSTEIISLDSDNRNLIATLQQDPGSDVGQVCRECPLTLTM